jgi:hypothetical protein
VPDNFAASKNSCMKEVTVILMGIQLIPSSQQCCHAHSNVQEFLKGEGLLKSNNYPTAPIYEQKPFLLPILKASLQGHHSESV